MSDVSVGLYGVEETFGGELVPPLDGLFLRQVVEGVVDFDGVEMLCVVLEPFTLRQFGRVEQLLPVVVIPSRCAYSNLDCRQTSIAGRVAHIGYFNVLNGFENGYNLLWSF